MDLESLSFIDSVSTGLMVLDESGRIVKTNNALNTLLGYSQGELNNLPVSDIIQSPASLHGKEHLLVRKNGNAINADVFFKPYGKIGQLVTIIDATERVSAMSMLEDVQEINKTGTWSFDLVNDVVWWSPELFHIFELPVADTAPPYDTHKSLFTAESWERLEPAVAMAAQEGIPYELELTLSKVKNENYHRIAVARCEPQKDHQGNVVKLIGTFQNITELASARESSRQLLNRLTLAKQAAGIGIWEWDLDTDALVFDEKMYAIYGINVPVVNYDMWRSFVHPDDIDAVESSISQAIADNGTLDSNFRISRQGEIRHIMAFATVKTRSMVGINMDITEQVKLREEARRINNLESLGALAGGIAHDFNNQLASISARADILSLQAADTEFVERIARELQMTVESATSLTKQLLTFAKGGVHIRESASVTNLVTQNADFSLHGTAIRVNYIFDDTVWNIDADPHQIGQVIQNIVINAVQAMASKGSALTITVQNSTVDDSLECLEAGDYVEVAIQDNGPGMPEDIASRVFEPYFTTKQSGNGLGLAICYSIIKQHQGHIEVDSTLDQGTKFVIYLPKSTTVTEKAVDNAMLRPGKGRILIVDDMTDVLESMGMMVEALGYDVELSTNVDEAVARYTQAENRRHPFSLVITDLTMPGSGGGIELLERLRERQREIKVIVATGYANHADKGSDHGFDGHLTKPCTLNDLSDEIHRVTSS